MGNLLLDTPADPHLLFGVSTVLHREILGAHRFWQAQVQISKQQTDHLHDARIARILCRLGILTHYHVGDNANIVCLRIMAFIEAKCQSYAGVVRPLNIYFLPATILRR